MGHLENKNVFTVVSRISPGKKRFAGFAKLHGKKDSKCTMFKNLSKKSHFVQHCERSELLQSV